MNLFTKVIFALFTFSVFNIAAEQRRADIYVDEDLYKFVPLVPPEPQAFPECFLLYIS